MSKFIYQNYLDTRYFPSHLLSAQNEWASAYAIENLIDPLLTVVWRSGTLDTRIYLDSITGVNPTHLILNAHNLTSTAVVTVEACDDNDFTTPEFSSVATWESGMLVHSFTSASSYRYWSIHIVDANNTNYIEIGHAFLGAGINLTTGAHNSFNKKKNDNSKRTITDTGSVFGSVWGNPHNAYSLNFAWVSETIKRLIEAMYDDYTRNVQPLYFQLPDTYSDNYDVLYCVIDPPEFTHIIDRGDDTYWSMKTIITEAR